MPYAYYNQMVNMSPEKIIEFTTDKVNAQLRVWAAPDPGHIDYEADEFHQQASIDLWLALQKRPTLKTRGMTSIVRRSMTDLLRKRLGPKGHRTMTRMCTESLDRFEAPACDYPFVLYDTFDYISAKLGQGTGIILECFRRGASITDIIDALHMSVSTFYARLNRIRLVLES